MPFFRAFSLLFFSPLAFLSVYVRYGIGEEEHTYLNVLTGKGMGSIGRFSLLFPLRGFFDLAGVAFFFFFSSRVYMLGNSSDCYVL